MYPFLKQFSPIFFSISSLSFYILSSSFKDNSHSTLLIIITSFQFIYITYYNTTLSIQINLNIIILNIPLQILLHIISIISSIFAYSIISSSSSLYLLLILVFLNASISLIFLNFISFLFHLSYPIYCCLKSIMLSMLLLIHYEFH